MIMARVVPFSEAFLIVAGLMILPSGLPGGGRPFGSMALVQSSMLPMHWADLGWLRAVLNS